MRWSAYVATLSLVIAFAFPLSVVSKEPDPLAIGVLTLHGVGSHGERKDFDRKLRTTLQKKAGGNTTIVVKPVYYHGESRNRQAKLWKEFDRLEDTNPGALDQKYPRRLMLETLGDALAYANNPRDKNSFYRSAHEKVRGAIDELESEIGDGRPIAVIAHSLGCKVMFDYICDAQAGMGIWEGNAPPSEFQKLANLRVLITTGCNLPFFESAIPAPQQRFFRVNKDFQWINFYDRDDLLGWPLRPLGGAFQEIVQDEERNKIGWTLTAHFNYWKHDGLNQEIASKILELTRANAPASKNE